MHDTKAIALAWMQACVAGEIDRVRAFYAPDCRFLVAGDMPYCGWMNLDAFLSQTAILPLGGPLTMEIGDITADAGKVWFEAQSFGVLKDGQPYENSYVFFLRLRDGLIVEYKEFIDTLYVYRTIDSPFTRGAPQPRYRIFDTPSVTMTGSALGESRRDPASPE